MKKALKQEWIRRLRSGEYTQGHGRLVGAKLVDDTGKDIPVPPNPLNEQRLKSLGVKTVKCNCCLGVLCEALGLKADKISPTTCLGYSIEGKGWINSKFPKSLLEEIGLSSDQQPILINMNDRLRYNFNQIADWINVNVQEEKE